MCRVWSDPRDPQSPPVLGAFTLRHLAAVKQALGLSQGEALQDPDSRCGRTEAQRGQGRIKSLLSSLLLLQGLGDLGDVLSLAQGQACPASPAPVGCTW